MQIICILTSTFVTLTFKYKENNVVKLILGDKNTWETCFLPNRKIFDILTLNCVTLTLIQDHVISTIYFSHSNSVTLKKKELDIYPSIQLWAEMLELDKDTHRPDRNLYHVSIVAHFIGATRIIETPTDYRHCSENAESPIKPAKMLTWSITFVCKIKSKSW